METPQEHLLSALPGISEARAADLLKYCGTAAWAFNWLTECTLSAATVPGIGDGTRRNVRTVLGLKDNEYLAVYVGGDTEKEKIDE